MTKKQAEKAIKNEEIMTINAMSEWFPRDRRTLKAWIRETNTEPEYTVGRYKYYLLQDVQLATRWKLSGSSLSFEKWNLRSLFERLEEMKAEKEAEEADTEEATED